MKFTKQVLESIFLGDGHTSMDLSYADAHAPKVVVRGFIILPAGSTGLSVSLSICIERERERERENEMKKR